MVTSETSADPSGLELRTKPNQPFYRERRLRMYDAVVVKASNRVLWRCRWQHLVNHYEQHIGGVHLEIGPGTAFYLDRCTFPTPRPEITLLDVNPDPLRYAARRLARYEPRAMRADILRALPDLGRHDFQSVAINYVLHCLPTPAGGKQVVFGRLKRVMRPGGVLFGSTIVTHGAQHTLLSRAVNRLYQRQGSFHNSDDSVDELHAALGRHFATHRIEVRGSVAMFAASDGPRRTTTRS